MKAAPFYANIQLQLNSAVFQAGGLVVLVVEIFRKNFLASIVPVIVNAVLDSHHVIVDIIAFVSKGDFPRSRLGEKQRGKILASWVTRKMHTIAQFSIRDPDGTDSQMTEVGDSAAHAKNGGFIGAPSLRSVAEDEQAQQLRIEVPQQSSTRMGPPHDYAPLPHGISEMPDTRSPIDQMPLEMPGSDDTPTDLPKELPVPSHGPALDYSPADEGLFFKDDNNGRQRAPVADDPQRSWTTDHERDRPLPSYARKPYLDLPGVRGTGSGVIEPNELAAGGPDPRPQSDLHTLPSQRRDEPQYDYPLRATSIDPVSQSGTGGLRVANRNDKSDADDWAQDAMSHMKLGR